MSYRLEYQWVALRVAGAPLGFAEDRFIIVIEGGDNNLYDARCRRSRSWNACMVGTRNAVLRQAVYMAGACEGGSLQPHGRHCTPESYIRRIRRLLDHAEDKLPCGGSWQPCLHVAQDHPVVAEIRSIGVEVRIESWYGSPRATAGIPSEHLAAYFGLIDRYIAELPAWCWIKVYGLPPS